VGAGREGVEVAGRSVAREVAAGESEVGGDVAIELSEPLDLGRLQASRILAGLREQPLQLLPAGAMGADELVDGGQWTIPTA